MEHKVKCPSTEKTTAGDSSGGYGWVVVADRIAQWRRWFGRIEKILFSAECLLSEAVVHVAIDSEALAEFCR